MTACQAGQSNPYRLVQWVLLGHAWANSINRPFACCKFSDFYNSLHADPAKLDKGKQFERHTIQQGLETNYHLLKVGGLAQLGCRRLKSSNRTKLNVHKSKYL